MNDDINDTGISIFQYRRGNSISSVSSNKSNIGLFIENWFYGLAVWRLFHSEKASSSILDGIIFFKIIFWSKIPFMKYLVYEPYKIS